MAFAAAAGLPAILSLVGTGLAVAGTIASTSAAIQSANYQAMIAERNQQVQEINSKRALDAARQELIAQEEQTRGLLGEQLAIQSASGLRIGGRSQMLTRKSARALGRRDAENVVKAGDIAAYNFRIGAEDAALQATFARQTAGNALLAGFLDAGSTLVGGVTPLFKQTSLLGASKFAKMTVPKAKNLRFVG